MKHCAGQSNTDYPAMLLSFLYDRFTIGAGIKRLKFRYRVPMSFDMKRYLLVIMLCILPTKRSHAQEDELRIWRGFHPFFESAISLANGYTAGPAFGTGAEWQTRHFLVDANAGYGFMRKNNDNAQVPHEHGHTRGLGGDFYLLKGHNLVGLGAGWGETAVTPYRKYSWSPSVSVGREFTWARLTASYYRNYREYTNYPTPVNFTPGPGQPALSKYSIGGNGVTGVNIRVLYAFTDGGRFLADYSCSIYRFHTTVTDTYNTALTAEQKAQKYTGGSCSFGLVLRR